MKRVTTKIATTVVAALFTTIDPTGAMQLPADYHNLKERTEERANEVRKANETVSAAITNNAPTARQRAAVEDLIRAHSAARDAHVAALGAAAKPEDQQWHASMAEFHKNAVIHVKQHHLAPGNSSLNKPQREPQ